jgi:hypothetical protein
VSTPAKHTAAAITLTIQMTGLATTIQASGTGIQVRAW